MPPSIGLLLHRCGRDRRRLRRISPRRGGTLSAALRAMFTSRRSAFLFLASLTSAALGCARDEADGAGGDANAETTTATGLGPGQQSSATGFEGAGGSPPVSEKGCQYVDLLFVIDNSPSMGPHQEALAAAFPGFVDAMYEKLPSTVNLHVGITTTSFFSGSCSESTVNCVSAASPAEILAHYTKPTDGSTNTNGEQGRFFERAGKAFFEANVADPDRAPLKAWFSEAATEAGESGCSFEMASAGAAYAAHPANAATNGGFFRDDGGVLLVIVLSDEPDKSPEGVDTYRDMLRAVKTGCGGDACILTAGLVNPCIEDVDDTLFQFLNAFGEAPIVGDIDEPADYGAVVGDALAQVVKSTCDEIVVPK